LTKLHNEGRVVLCIYKQL